MIHLKISSTRTLFMRAGMRALSSLLGIGLLFIMVISDLSSSTVVICIGVLLIGFVWLDFCGTVSEILCNSKRLVVVTPFRCRCYRAPSVIEIVTARAPLASNAFIFTIKGRRGTRAKYHFFLSQSDDETYYATIEELTRALSQIAITRMKKGW